jgi:hypothetical protein
MFTFHHVNAFTTSASSGTNGNGNGSSNGNGSRSKQQLVLDTVAWDEVAFENNQVRGAWRHSITVLLQCLQCICMSSDGAPLHAVLLWWQCCKAWSSCHAGWRDCCVAGKLVLGAMCCMLLVCFALTLPASVAAAACCIGFPCSTT